jgi:hypothetical protein
MQKRDLNIELTDDVHQYISGTTQSFQIVLRDKLVGLYLCGSLVQDDFETRRSDIDLLGVVSEKLDDILRKRLVSVLSHEARAVPARGLEVVLFLTHAARSPEVGFPFEFALSTGPKKEPECEPPGTADDMLIDIALCRDAGITLAGAPADEVFAPIPRYLLRHALIEELYWHQREVQKRLDATSAANAILNAARSLHAAETGRILSKTQGGRWWLQRYPFDETVSRALSFRETGRAALIAPVAAGDFVDMVIHRIEALST